MKRVHLVIQGRVQGVCFRMYTKEKAMQFNVTGWVRNLSNGCVEIAAEGEDGDISHFLLACKKGPPFAEIKGVDETNSVATGEFDSFQIRY